MLDSFWLPEEMEPLKMRAGESGSVGLPFLQAAKRLKAKDEAQRRIKALDLILTPVERRVLT